MEERGGRGSGKAKEEDHTTHAEEKRQKKAIGVGTCLY
jgi:hypothetical protein